MDDLEARLNRLARRARLEKRIKTLEDEASELKVAVDDLHRRIMGTRRGN